MKILKFNDFLSSDKINESNQFLLEEEKEISYKIEKGENTYDFTELYKLLEV
jgi:hypothetical protein